MLNTVALCRDKFAVVVRLKQLSFPQGTNVEQRSEADFWKGHEWLRWRGEASEAANVFSKKRLLLRQIINVSPYGRLHYNEREKMFAVYTCVQKRLKFFWNWFPKISAEIGILSNFSPRLVLFENVAKLQSQLQVTTGIRYASSGRLKDSLRAFRLKKLVGTV